MKLVIWLFLSLAFFSCVSKKESCVDHNDIFFKKKIKMIENLSITESKKNLDKLKFRRARMIFSRYKSFLRESKDIDSVLLKKTWINEKEILINNINILFGVVYKGNNKYTFDIIEDEICQIIKFEKKIYE